MQQQFINGYPYMQYSKEQFDESTMLQRSAALYQWADARRTCRDFSDKTFDKKILENIIKTANTAPSGAHKQPWTFCIVEDPILKKQIRIAAEAEEKESYENRMNAEWLEDLKPLGTDWKKPFLETAPYLIIVFKKSYDIDENGNKKQNYYAIESVGLACGLLLAAIHHAGLVALTHTPSPMNFLRTLLHRPDNEKPFLLIPIGYLADECLVPDIKRKSLEEISIWF